MKWADLGALFTPSEKAKIAGIEDSATADQTGAEIKTAYEGEADTNAYDDAAVTKLAGAESGATKYPDVGEQAFTDADHSKLDAIETGASSTEVITAGDGITVTHRTMRIIGPAAPVDITANPQMAAGADGQVVILQGCHDTYTVKIDDGNGVITAGSASRTLGDNDMLMLSYDSGESAWIEISYSNNHA